MCGVIGLICERPRADLGRVAAELLKTLEYRGYDSTGAAFQGTDEEVHLLKGVGAPSAMVHKLGIVNMGGKILCGQVRWATFGAVTEANSQPHVVRCKTHLYGAHNGNVTNCDELKAWLCAEGHDVRSDNDGEMVVHTVEHCFALAVAALPEKERHQPTARRRAMRDAIGSAVARMQGSFAAVIVDPVSRVLWAIKMGSSLYFGFGADAVGGRFALASSDLSSVLKLTHVMLPVSEGELIEYDAQSHVVWGLEKQADTQAFTLVERAREPVRSRLRAEDTALMPPFESFMDQEIAAQESTVANLVRLYHGGSEHALALGPHLGTAPSGMVADLRNRLEVLRDQVDEQQIRVVFDQISTSAALAAVRDAIPATVCRQLLTPPAPHLAEQLVSAEARLLGDLVRTAGDDDARLAVLVLDVLLEQEEVKEFKSAVARFAELAQETLARGGRLFVTCCGSSLHAAKAGALFFHDICHVGLIPILPGEFRGQYLRTLRDGDMVMAISQSGETKDLIDVMNDILASGHSVARVGLVNNINSTLAQEKCQLVIPLHCGPEIAVPATKSFMNQMALLYALAVELGRHRSTDTSLPSRERDEIRREVDERGQRLRSLPALLRATFDVTALQVDTAAEMLFLRPSLHLLATRISAVAREGALKIREVVLNHAEGFEGSEFKHGPNTILGFNTVWGPEQVELLLSQVGQTLDNVLCKSSEGGLDGRSARRLAQAVVDSVFSRAPAFSLTPAEGTILEKQLHRDELRAALQVDYPLIYITGPEERDVNLTISQINTHKIRGASTVVVAEENASLRTAASKPPVDNPAYRWAYITLPRTGDTLMTVFSSTVVLQRLAFRMSMMKMQYLDRLGVRDHGVHPDVPKNVSKSITVD